MMPQTKTQGAVFGLLMSYFMALGMEVANTAHKLGAMSNAVFLPALKETAFMGAIVFVVSTLYGSRAGPATRGVFRAIFHKQLVENDRKAFSSDTECDKMDA